jgi:dihydrolipoamide dehydrogenase
MVGGIHYLMKKNKITELHGWGTFVDAHSIEVAGNDGSTQTVTFDNCIIAAGATTKLLPARQLSANVITYKEQILADELPEVDHHRRLRRDRHRVRLRAQQPTGSTSPSWSSSTAWCPTRTPRSAELAKAYKKLGIKVLTGTAVQGVEDTGSGVRLPSSPPRAASSVGPRGRQDPAGHRLRAAPGRLRPGEHRRRGDRARSDRHRRLHAHQRAGHLRDRRLHRAS